MFFTSVGRSASLFYPATEVIEKQKTKLQKQEGEIENQKVLLQKQQSEIEALKQVVCADNKEAQICFDQ